MSTQTDYVTLTHCGQQTRWAIGMSVYYTDLDGNLACGRIEAIRRGPHWGVRQWLLVDMRWVCAEAVEPAVLLTPQAA